MNAEQDQDEDEDVEEGVPQLNSGVNTPHVDSYSCCLCTPVIDTPTYLDSLPSSLENFDCQQRTETHIGITKQPRPPNEHRFVYFAAGMWQKFTNFFSSAAHAAALEHVGGTAIWWVGGATDDDDDATSEVPPGNIEVKMPADLLPAIA